MIMYPCSEPAPSLSALAMSDEELNRIQSDSGKWTRRDIWQRFTKFWTGSNHQLTTVSTYPYVLDTHLNYAVEDVTSFANIDQKILVTKSYEDLYQRIKKHLKLEEIDKQEQDYIQRPPSTNLVC